MEDLHSGKAIKYTGPSRDRTRKHSDYIHGYTYRNLQAELTCPNCPEQYDVFNEKGELVATFSSRWGCFMCETAESNSEILFECELQDKIDFKNEEERRNVLTAGFIAILLRQEKDS